MGLHQNVKDWEIQIFFNKIMNSCSAAPTYVNAHRVKLEENHYFL
jgi:patatin-like phospholipase/acyl hydrolase